MKQQILQQIVDKQAELIELYESMLESHRPFMVSHNKFDPSADIIRMIDLKKEINKISKGI